VNLYDTVKKPVAVERNAGNITFKYALGDIGIRGNVFHEHYEMFLLICGNVEYINEKNRYYMNHYDLIIIPPGAYHQFVIQNNIESYERCILEFRGGCLTGIDTAEILKGKDLYHLTASHRITEIFLKLKAYCSDEYTDDFNNLLPALLTELLIVIKHESSNVFYSVDKPRSTTVKALEFINKNIAERLTLELIAKNLYVSASSLRHIFSQELNISVTQYIKQKRILMANEMIKQGKRPTEIFFQCGFSDYTTFFRAYKAFFKKPPSKRN